MSVEQLFQNSHARTILAPMAGYTDPAYRSICRNYGVGLTVTEMVSSMALVSNNELTKILLKKFPNDSPCFVQIFGHDPTVMAESVKLPEMQNFYGVDINMGCPVRKIVSNGDGSALLANPKLASRCISAVKQAIGDKPLSVKFRLGVADSSGAADFAKMCADSGADFITVHFRTRMEMYSGKADFSTLPQIVKCGIPVFANGDVETRSRYLQLLEQGAFGVSVGRGALGRPYVFSEISGEHYTMDVLETILQHTKMLGEYLPERTVCNEIKKHVVCYLKGMRNSKTTAVSATQSNSVQDLVEVVTKYFAENSQYRVKTND